MAIAKPAEKSPALVKARVRPNNSYHVTREKIAVGGDIVEVSPIDLKVCAHALISIDEEEAAAKADAAKSEAQTSASDMFDALRLASRRQHEQDVAARDLIKRQAAAHIDEGPPVARDLVGKRPSEAAR